MLQAICCATVSGTSERMCRRADKWKLQARTTVETCLSKLMVRSSLTPRSFRLSLTATQNSQRHATVPAAAPEHDVEHSSIHSLIHSLITSGRSYVCANFGENRSRNATVRVLADRQTDRQTHWQMQTDFVIFKPLPCIDYLPHSYSI